MRIAFIGFGEVGQRFAKDLRVGGQVRLSAYDLKFDAAAPGPCLTAARDLGVAVESKFPNVGGIVPWGQAGVGAVWRTPRRRAGHATSMAGIVEGGRKTARRFIGDGACGNLKKTRRMRAAGALMKMARRSGEDR